MKIPYLGDLRWCERGVYLRVDKRWALFCLSVSLISFKTVQIIPIYHERELLLSLKRGNERAFTDIYNHYWDRLFVVAANKLDRDLALAEELVQDIFLDLWNRRQTIEVKGELAAYLATALKYKVIDARLRRAKVNKYIEQAVPQLSIVDNSTEAQLHFEELQQRLSLLVCALPEKCRLVYALSKETGLSHKAIAQQLNISEKTVEAHLARALRSLRVGMAQFLSCLF